MATLIASATGNFTSSSIWELVDSTSFLDSEAGNTALTTSFVSSSAFTPGAITIDGIAVKIASRAASPTGTMSVRLFNSTGAAAVAGTTVTINVSDITADSTVTGSGGWYFFKFSSSVTLLAATNYTVQASTSSSTQVNLYRDGTANNWSRCLRTTTNQAPASTDVLIMTGEWTSAATKTDITVTMNETATTAYGKTYVGKGGTLQYGTATATNYVLRLAGDLVLNSTGVLNIGTTGTPMPSTSTAVLEFDCASDGQYGLIVYNSSVLVAQGNAITTNALLAADASASATSLTTSVSTGWKNGDNIALAPTSRTYTEAETKSLTADASGTTLTISAITNARSGTSPTQAELVNLTRNVKIRSVSSTNMTYIDMYQNASVDIDYVEFRYLGVNSINKYGFNIRGGTNTNSISVRYSSMWDFESYIVNINTVTTNFEFSDNVLYNCNSAATAIAAFYMTAGGTYSNLKINNNIWIGCKCTTSTTNGIVRLNGLNTQFNGNVFAGCDSGSTSNAAVHITSGLQAIEISGLTCHTNRGYGIFTESGSRYQTWQNFTLWRNGNYGFATGSSTFNTKIRLYTATMFGNTTGNMLLQGGTNLCIFRSLTLRGDASFSTGVGISCSHKGWVHIYNSSLGATTAHTTADISNSMSAAGLYLYNTSLNSTTEISNSTSLDEGFGIFMHKYDANSTQFRIIGRFGQLDQETTNRKTASGYAWKITPNATNNSGSDKICIPALYEDRPFKAVANASSLVTITAWVLKNAAYNGNAARLVLLGGIIGGISSDVTASAAEPQRTITAATNASPIAITTSANHGYSTGDRILIESVGGNTAANGMWTVTVTSSTTFTLDSSSGNGTYTSGGTSNRYEQLTVTGTPNEAGVLEFYVDCDGTAGNIWVDDIAVTQA
jgi:hypothetical protein